MLNFNRIINLVEKDFRLRDKIIDLVFQYKKYNIKI